MGFVRLSILVFFVLISSAWAGEEKVVAESYNRHNPVSVKADSRENVWATYYDLNDRVHIKNMSGNKDLIINDARVTVPKGLALDIQGDNIFVAWREKIQGKKEIWFRASHDGGKTLSEPVLLDADSEPLTRIKIASNSRGEVFVCWYGEKKVSSENKVRSGKKGKDADYNIYCTSSRDSGRTFSEVVNITHGYENSIYPSILVDEEGAYTFSYSRKGDKKYMVFRKATDGGKTWSDPLEIKEIGVVTLFVEPVKIEKRLHVFWFNTYDGVPVIEGAFSDDGGRTWKTTVFSETKGLDVGLLKVAYDKKGHVYLAFYGKWDEKEKGRVYIISSGDNGDTWGKLTPLRHYPYAHTRAMNPDIAVMDNGEVVVAWVDYRNIRSNLYMQYSKDSGRTWQEKDIPLEEPGRYNTAFYPFNINLITAKDRFYALAYRFKDDFTLKEAKLILIDFSLDGGGAK